MGCLPVSKALLLGVQIGLTQQLFRTRPDGIKDNDDDGDDDDKEMIGVEDETVPSQRVNVWRRDLI